MRYQIVDENFKGSSRMPDGVVAETNFIDVAELMALGYARSRYGGRMERGTLEGMKPISVLDTKDDKILIRYGLVLREQIGAMEFSGDEEEHASKWRGRSPSGKWECNCGKEYTIRDDLMNHIEMQAQ